jgi:hypothetical protein
MSKLLSFSSTRLAHVLTGWQAEFDKGLHLFGQSNEYKLALVIDYIFLHKCVKLKKKKTKAQNMEGYTY